MANRQEAKRKRAELAPLIQNTPAKKESPKIDYTRPEISALSYKWQVVNDCLQGQERIKAARDLYLPQPNSADTSEANKLRYDNYVARAVFYNVTKYTMEGLIGQVFSRDPIIALPDGLKSMIDDVDGEGVSLDQQAKQGLGYSLGYGGFALLVDYPSTEGQVSIADQQSGKIHPTITQYQRKNVINWRHKKRGARSILKLVVIRESGPVSDDGFEVKYEDQWRVLELVNDVYQISTWIKTDDGFEIKEGPITPTDGKGKPFDEIPLFFCGVTNNNSVPDLPILYDLAELNIAHYRNSADYEDSCYLVGQPTPVFAGLTKQWVNDVFKNQPIQLGSRAAVALPVGGTANFMQANPNSMPKEAMDQKESQMAALGARIIKEGSGRNTLGEAQQDESTETSQLATAAKNVSACYTAALKVAAKMHDTPDEELSYSLNTDFPASRLTPNERNQTVLEWQAGAISFTEMRAVMRKGGVATLDEEDFKADVAKNPPPVEKEATNNGDKGGSDNDPKQNKDEQNNGGNQNGV